MRKLHSEIKCRLLYEIRKATTNLSSNKRIKAETLFKKIIQQLDNVYPESMWLNEYYNKKKDFDEAFVYISQKYPVLHYSLKGNAQGLIREVYIEAFELLFNRAFEEYVTKESLARSLQIIASFNENRRLFMYL